MNYLEGRISVRRRGVGLGKGHMVVRTTGPAEDNKPGIGYTVLATTNSEVAAKQIREILVLAKASIESIQHVDSVLSLKGVNE